MKKHLFIMAVGCLLLMPAAAQGQLDKMLDRFLPREESRVQAGDLKVLHLAFARDPVREGQLVRFRVIVANTSRYSGRVSFLIKDRDEVISQAREVTVYPGENQIDFPEMNYRFSRSDHCFTVEADIEFNRRPIDVAKEFCAQRTRAGWTLEDRGLGTLFVEDLDMIPDPAAPGQEVRFRVKLRNDGRPIRGSIRIQDKDQVVVQAENITIPRGYSDFQFPQARYAFQRFDHCFIVLVDVERTPYPVEAARKFCAKPAGWTLRP